MRKPEYIYNTKGLLVEFHRVREGPNFFTVLYKFTCQGVTTVKEMKKVLGPAKFLDSSKELYAWMEPLIALSEPVKSLDMDVIKARGFGPEAHDEPIVNDTKMVV
jgi:hypothetical protein